MFVVADHSVACLYLLDEFLWKMEHSRILAGLILAAFLPQGKRGIFSCAEEGPQKGWCHWKKFTGKCISMPASVYQAGEGQKGGVGG